MQNTIVIYEKKKNKKELKITEKRESFTISYSSENGSVGFDCSYRFFIEAIQNLVVNGECEMASNTISLKINKSDNKGYEFIFRENEVIKNKFHDDDDFCAKKLDAFRLMFREYDVRGEVNDNAMNELHVRRIIMGFATILHRKGISEVVVGYDNREYSPAFSKAAIDALVTSGLNVYDIGLSLSPVTYFAQYHLNCQGAVMITASHNPNGWSGFKLGQGFSQTLGPEDVKELYNIVLDGDFISKEGGTVAKVNVRNAYIEKIVNSVNVNKEKTPKVVIEAGNGGAGVFAYEIFQKIGCLTFQLYCDPDVNYPHYSPNPSDLKVRKRLAQMVTHEYVKADIGMSFDGDGDRIGIVDEHGENIWSDKILMVLAQQLLEKKKGAKIVFDVKCSQGLAEVIETNGGIPIMWKTGHSYIKSKMNEENADLAGERSGHIFVGGNDYYGYDDAIFTAVKLVEFMSHTGKSIDEIIAKYPQYVTSPEIKADCADAVKYSVVEKVTKELQDEYGDRVNTVNGARVSFDNGWGLVRASSNLGELVLIFEGKTEQDMIDIRKIFKEKLDKFPEVAKNWSNDI